MTKPLRIDGIDLSHYQTQKIDYAAAKKAGVKFVYHKATESTTYVDPMYDQRRREAKAAGIFFGAYHFARPALGTAVAEAHWFLKHAQPVPGNMLPVLDLEVNDHNMSVDQLSAWVSAWWTTVQKALGIDNGITYTHYNLTKTANTYLWAPRYSNDNALPLIPRPWKKFTIRQFSDGVYGVPNSVPGVGHVDINHIRNGFLGLHRLGWVTKLTIPAKQKPKPIPKSKRVNLVLESAPLHTERSDWAAKAPSQVEAACKRGADVIAFTELHGHLADTIAGICAQNGYDFFHDKACDSALAFKTSLNAQAGLVHDTYPFVKVEFDFHGSQVTVFGLHWRTNKPQHAVARETLTKELVHEMNQASLGKRLAFYMADCNPDAPQGQAGSQPVTALKAAGIPTIWQELKQYPPHLGVNVIGRNVQDTRVSPVSVTLHAPLGSDHYPATAVYSIKV